LQLLMAVFPDVVVLLLPAGQLVQLAAVFVVSVYVAAPHELHTPFEPAALALPAA
jgi:hypothetical protein